MSGLEIPIVNLHACVHTYNIMPNTVHVCMRGVCEVENAYTLESVRDSKVC